jgi:hypothetical protein
MENSLVEMRRAVADMKNTLELKNVTGQEISGYLYDLNTKGKDIDETTVVEAEEKRYAIVKIILENTSPGKTRNELIQMVNAIMKAETWNLLHVDDILEWPSHIRAMIAFELGGSKGFKELRMALSKMIENFMASSECGQLLDPKTSGLAELAYCFVYHCYNCDNSDDNVTEKELRQIDEVLEKYVNIISDRGF